jgi:tetratricopeptide (TPR) repeat protein
MEFDLSWILLGLPLAFILGWLASRMDLRQLRLENRQTPKAYFKGLNYLLNEQQDQAIDAFIEAVQHDPDTSELHFALGNLFRRRGDGHQTRGALAIQAHPRRGDIQAGGQGGLPRDIGAGRALLEGGAHDHVLNLGRIDARTGHRVADGVTAQLLRLGVVEGPAISAADGGPGGRDNDGFAGHL